MDTHTKAIDLLLIEDNASDAELTIRELKKYNMANNLIHLRNGSDALNFFKTTDTLPKLILLDIQMPKINGIEVLQRLKENPLTRSIPVVMLTSSKENPDIQKCYSLGANSYIVKPVNFDDFAKTIKTLGFYWLLFNQPHTL